jgi:hypothetical protein
MIHWPSHSNNGRRRRDRGRPYVYSHTVIMRCFIVRIWFRLDANNALHEFLTMDYPYNKKISKTCGLTKIPDRRNFDRRLGTISTDLKERITVMANHFIHEGIIDAYAVAIDSTLLKAKGYVWHKSSMKKGIVPRSGIDTDARWGFSHGKGWIFGYKLHLISSIGSIIVLLRADFTTANVHDNLMYIPMISSSSSLSSSSLDCICKNTFYLIGDSGYDDQNQIDRTVDRTSKTCIQNRSMAYKRTSHGSRASTTICPCIPDTCLP